MSTMGKLSLIIENHPNDSRVKIANVFQTLSSRIGTGGQYAYGIMFKRSRGVRNVNNRGTDSDIKSARAWP